MDQLRALFSAPDFPDPEKTLVARQVSLILRAFIVAASVLQAIQIAIAPGSTGHWLALLLTAIVFGIFLLVLNRKGRVRVASWLLVSGLWLLISAMAVAGSGLGIRAAWGYFIVVFIAGMTLGHWPAVAAAALSSAATLALGMLAPSPSSDPFRFWLINSIYLLAGLMLQNLASRTIRASMSSAIAELRERVRTQAVLANSEKRHRELVNSLPFYVFEADLDGRIRFLNLPSLDWFGYSEAEIRAGVSIFQVLDESEASRARENIGRLIAGEEPASREYLIRRRNGRTFTALVRTRILRENGAPAGLQGILIDISERKRFEKEREMVISLLRATVESTADGILVIDREGKIAHFNQRFKQLWRIPDEILADGKDETALAFVLDQLVDREGFLAKVQDLYAEPRAESFDVLEFKDGRVFERFSRPQMLGGAPVGRVWSFRDITGHRRLEEQLLQAQKMEAVGILAGGVAHDFNNILSTIVGYGSLLHARPQADPQDREYIEKILDSCERAVRLTGSLLTFSRKQEVELQTLDINDVIFQFHKILARMIGEDIELRIDLDSQALAVDADLHQIEQVLMNLATNARDAMPRGGRLTISTSAMAIDQDGGQVPRGAYAVIAVADSGVGMTPAVQSHIFEPFFTTKEVGRGTGLGLAIVYGIVKKHGGFVTMDSAAGKGTTFSLFLPLKSKPAKAAAGRQRETIPAGSETILLIEDDPAVRQVVRSMLQEFGYSVLEAENGEIAQEVFRRERERVRLVLCDLIMPRLNGRETLAAIRRLQPDIKAIFMSGYDADIIAGKGVAGDSIHLLMKPLNPGVLLRKVREVLDG